MIKLKELIKRFIYFIKRNIKRIIIVYIILMLPINYAMVAATTNLEISETNKIVKASIKSPLNIITLGFYKPIKSEIQIGYGYMHREISDILNDDKGKILAQNSINRGKAWFDFGNEQIDSSNDLISRISGNSNVETSYNNKIDNFNYKKYPNYYKSLGLANINTKNFSNSVAIKRDNESRIINARVKLNYNNKININEKVSNINKYKIIIPGFNGKIDKKYALYERNIIQFDHINNNKNNKIISTFNFQYGNVDHNGGLNKINNYVSNYLNKNKDQNVYYIAHLNYDNKKDKIPSYIIISMMSDNKEINQKVQIFNVSNNWKINYNNGKLN